MDLGLTGRTVFVTGPAKGMGAAITAAFASEGCRLALAGRDLDAIAPVADAARAGGADVVVLGCDIESPDSVERAAAKTMSRYGRIDVLVNVAGGSGPVGTPSWQTSPAEFEQIVRLNMNGCFHTMRAVLPGMIEQRYGKIVNVGGTFGLRGRAGRMSYSASKWGLRGITKSTALEVGQYNINVNLVAPGMVDGERFRSKVVPDAMRRHQCSEQEAVDRHAAEYALRRISADRDVANACLFLASDVSRQITGIDLPVDGGWAAL
ncbi:SDR family oxidoreductase [Acetobacteraceae bacterium KSS8]|uniref:SDR family oxidoreductase n=1 Tax=Endosaccharibacter trunci TaxID=2812733 RepID=A0ABT1WB29_9PROT|nr:SDR family oxidoreductase [Acetobacteraceae bacterium KSS8]